MTREEKQLLLIDLCARLPYGIEILVDIDKEFDVGSIGELVGILPYTGKKYDIKEPLFYQKGCLTPLTVEEIRPYLRPMSSMTEEELRIYKGMNDALDENYEVHLDNAYSAFDWLNKNGFDYRGLIPMGLALEAPKDMYKTE